MRAADNACDTPNFAETQVALSVIDTVSPIFETGVSGPNVLTPGGTGTYQIRASDDSGQVTIIWYVNGIEKKRESGNSSFTSQLSYTATQSDVGELILIEAKALDASGNQNTPPNPNIDVTITDTQAPVLTFQSIPSQLEWHSTIQASVHIIDDVGIEDESIFVVDTLSNCTMTAPQVSCSSDKDCTGTFSITASGTTGTYCHLKATAQDVNGNPGTMETSDLPIYDSSGFGISQLNALSSDWEALPQSSDDPPLPKAEPGDTFILAAIITGGTPAYNETWTGTPTPQKLGSCQSPYTHCASVVLPTNQSFSDIKYGLQVSDQDGRQASKEIPVKVTDTTSPTITKVEYWDSLQGTQFVELRLLEEDGYQVYEDVSIVNASDPTRPPVFFRVTAQDAYGIKKYCAGPAGEEGVPASDSTCAPTTTIPIESLDLEEGDLIEISVVDNYENTARAYVPVNLQ
jgi:hypothetical protein